MPDTNAKLGHALRVRGSDIDPQIMHRRSLFRSVLVATQMNGRIADDSRHLTLITQNFDPPAPRRRRIRSAHAIQSQIPAIVDVLDHVTDFIGMRLEHHDSIRLARELRPGRSVCVALDTLRMTLDPIRPHPLTWHFKSCRTRGFQQTVQKISIAFRHVGSQPNSRRVDKAIAMSINRRTSQPHAWPSSQTPAWAHSDPPFPPIPQDRSNP